MLEVQHPVDYFKKEREVNEPVGEELHTEQISKSHEFNRTRRVNTRLDENPEPVEIEQPGTSERAGKKRPSIGEEDQSTAKRTSLSSQEEDKMKEVQDSLYVFVEAFIDNFAIDLAGHNLYAQGKTITAKSLVEEVVTGVTGGLVGITIGGGNIAGFIPSAVASSRGLIGRLLNIDKKKAIKITNAFAKVHKGDLSGILAEAATKIFHSFESQFINLKHDAGDELLMKMLAENAVKRALNYIAKNSEDISSDFITKGVILGKSEKVINITLKDLKFFSKGGQVKDADDSEIEIGELYEKTGIMVVKESDQPSYYRKSAVLDGSKYGYRLPLEWEEKNINSEDSQYTLEESFSGETKYQYSSRRYEYILKKEGVAQEASQVLSKMKDKAPAKTGDMNAIKEEILNRLEANQKEPHNQPPPKGIMFDLNKPIENFTGREKDLKDLHEKLSDQSVTAIVQKTSELSINSQTSNSGNLGSNSQQSSISGLGGIGKTQLALKYAEKYSTDYDNNVIWINAQDISDSFERLASKLGIAKKDVDDDERKTHDLAQEIYEHFKEAKSLFIFDNVENYRQIEKYLPKQFAGNKPSILITSRYRNWENTRVKVLDLNVFTLEEAKEFIKTKLEIAGGDSSQDKEIDELAEKLEKLPLALAQAVAYIEQSKNTNSKFGINDYLEKYDRKAKELLGSDALKKL